MQDFCVPKKKWLLVRALSLLFPQDSAKFKAMRMNQLYAIYYRIRKERG